MELPEVLDRVSDGIIALDTAWHVTFCNAAGARLVGRSPEQLQGTVLWDAFPEAIGSTFESNYRLAMERQQPVDFEEYFPPLAAWFAIRAFPSPDGLTIYFQDRTERRRVDDAAGAATQELLQSEARRQALLGALLRAQESERARIARDVHDDALQALAAADLRLHVMRRAVLDPEATRRLDAAQDAVRVAIERLRRLVFELEPAGLGSRGLIEAIENHLAAVVEGTELHADVTGDDLPDLPYRARLVVFRTVTEAIAQAVDNGALRLLAVSVRRDRSGSDIVVTVTDDGEPLEFDRMSGDPGQRMAAVRDQVAALGGTLTFGPADPRRERPGNEATLRVREEALMGIESDREPVP